LWQARFVINDIISAVKTGLPRHGQAVQKTWMAEMLLRLKRMWNHYDVRICSWNGAKFNPQKKVPDATTGAFILPAISLIHPA
jgi:hypothetical protein